MIGGAARALFIAIGAAALAAVVFVAAVFLSQSPQFWTALVLAVLCFLAMRRAVAVPVRLLWWNCGAVLGLWALIEAGTILSMGHGAAPIVPRAALALRLGAFLPGQLSVYDPILGNRLAPGAHAQEGGLVYNINADGLRVGPTPVPGLAPQGCVLFFGCSYTLGEGVSDDQTFSYLVQVKTGGRFQARNFGVSASAPHYALGQIESGMVDQAAHCVPTHAIYLVIPHHLVRVAGKSPVRFGPKYVLQPDGQLVRNGLLNSTTSQFLWDLLRYSSAVYVARYGYGSDHYPIDSEDFTLTVALLRAMHARLLDRYPGIHFDILYWDDRNDQTATELGKQLQLVGVPVHRVSALLPKIGEWHSRAYLGRSDHHPSPWAHEKIAAYIVQNILGISPQ